MGQHDATVSAESRNSDGEELRDLARGGIISLLGSILAAVGGFLLTIVITRLLGAAQAGVFFIVVAIFMILSEITELGADEGLVRSSAQLVATGRVDDLRRLNLVALGPVFLASLAAAAAAFVLAPELAEIFADPRYRGQATIFLQISAPFLAISAVRAVVLAGLRGLGDITGYTIANTAMPVSRPVLAIAVVALGFGPVAVMLSWSIPIAVTFAIGAIMLWRLIRRAEATHKNRTEVTGTDPAPPVSGTASIARDFWSFSGPRGAGAMIEIALVWLDVLIVGAMVSNHEAGIYAAASRFINSGMLVLAATRIAVAPQIAGLLAIDDRQTAERLYNVATGWVVAASWPLYLVFIVFGPVVLAPFGPEFTEGDTALAVLASSMLVLLAAGNVQTVLLMGGKSSLALANKVATLVVNVVLSLALIPHLGIVGAAIAGGAGILIDTVAALVQVHRYVGLRLRIVSLLFPGISTIIWFGAVGCVIRFVFGSSPAAFLAYLLVAGAGYAVTLWFGRKSLHADLLVDVVRRRRS